MTEINTTSDNYTKALAELTGFIEETEKKNQEEKPKKKFFDFEEKQPVPRKEAAGDEEGPLKKDEEEGPLKKAPEYTYDDVVMDDEAEENKESEKADENQSEKKHEIVKSDFGKNKLSEDVTPRPRYVDASDLTATISVECAKEAVAAMRALREIKAQERPFLMVMIRDDGTREIASYKTREAAIISMKREMDIYVNEIEPKDYSRIVYKDDGEVKKEDQIYEPTPAEEIAEDGTIKRPSEIDGTLHKVETEDRGIVYFETKNATARWDIYDMTNVIKGDQDDPAYESFKEEQGKAAAEKQEEKQKHKK